MTSPPMTTRDLTPITPGCPILFRRGYGPWNIRAAYLRRDDEARIYPDSWTAAELRQIADHMDRQAAPERKP